MAIVKANWNLSNGGLAVLRRSVSVDKDGRATMEIDCVCLTYFANNHAALFAKGREPFFGFNVNISDFGVVNNPKLSDISTESLNGLTYFKARYSGYGEQSFTKTRSSEQRSFQGSVSRVIVTGPEGFLTENPVTDTLSFDYISITETVTGFDSEIIAASSGAAGAATAAGSFAGAGFSSRAQGGVGPRFNIRRTRTFAIGGGSQENSGSVPTRIQIIETDSQTKNSDGTTSYTKTSTGVYEQS